ncbi:carbohydrate ABC transporter permease [Halobellus rarus]|uniref:Carbohydrate ABC transporter permease n=1 Tax=Halobellus rarus TaxID=1126237 RepID=A0ABD6CT66_9EURY|nr:sugar ABC transporter permease [Halobellus rarus]
MVNLENITRLEDAKRDHLKSTEESFIERLPISFEMLLLLPSILVLGVLSIIPLVTLLWLSVMEGVLSPTDTATFAGIQNYRAIFTNSSIIESWRVTGIYLFVSLGLQISLGTMVAVALDRVKYIDDLLTSIVLMPMLIAPVIVGFLWAFLLDPSFGLYTYLLNQLGFYTQSPMFSDSVGAMIAVIVMDTWQWTPLVSLILLARLKSIPQGLYEAARVDGASFISEFRYIELPMLQSAFVIALLLRSMDLMRFFTKIFITTEGGPGSSTKIIGYFVYEQTLRFGNLGTGSALGVVMLVVTILMGLFFVEAIMGGAGDE